MRVYTHVYSTYSCNIDNSISIFHIICSVRGLALFVCSLIRLFDIVFTLLYDFNMSLFFLFKGDCPPIVETVGD